MRKNKTRRGIVLSAVVLFGAVWIPEIRGNASAYLDQIEQETIEVDVQEDGSAILTYDLDWRVLDSTSEGALSWVKIGIPNEYAEELTALSDSIDEISYYGDGGDYVRLDLDRGYEEGEVVDLKFSIHQHCLYEENADEYLYEFTPGWFDDIPVDELTIRWEYDENTVSDMQKASEAAYQVVFRDLHPGEKVRVWVVYPKSDFLFQDEYEKSADSSSVWFVVFVVLVVVCGPAAYAFLLYARKNSGKPKDHYERNRGMGSVYVGSGRHHSHSSGCACACAGGGRAGCSRKNFFHMRMKKNRMPKR